MSQEYDQAMTSLRYFLEYRTKIFDFCVAVNGALLTVSVFHTGSGYAAILLSIFAFLVTLFSLLAERRSIELSDWYREAAITLEKELKYAAITGVHEKAMKSGVGYRKSFQALYMLILLSWLVRVAYLILTMVK